MAQQINLLTPILLTPKRYFSALAMLKGIALVGLGALALSAYLISQAGAARANDARIAQQAGAERRQLLAGLAMLPPVGDAKALQQQLDDARAKLEGQRQLWALLKNGQAQPGLAHSDLLRLLAATVPASVWLTEVRWQSGRLELDGATLDTAALRAWWAGLSAHPLLREHQLAALKVEKSARDDGSGGAPPSPTRSWTFSLRSESAGAKQTGPSGAPL